MRNLLLCLILVFTIGCAECPECPDCPDCPECPGCDSCCEVCPECPPCPETLECPDGYILYKDELKWECKLPDVGPDPDNYVPLDDVPEILDSMKDSRPHIGYFADAYANWRDPEYVSTYCTWALKGGSEVWLDVTKQYMQDFAKAGQALVHEMEYLNLNLPKVNRRCDPNHKDHHPDFCEVSKVTKSRLTQYKLTVRPHNIKANEWRDIVQRDPIREVCGYDSIRGWCQCRNNHVGFEWDDFKYSRYTPLPNWGVKKSK